MIADGDPLAFALLYSRLAHNLTATAMDVLHDGHLAEDTVQETFLELWRQPDRYDASRGSVERWLKVITRNRAISALRGHTARTAREKRYAAREYAEPEDTVVSGVLSRLTAEEVRAGLRLLSPLQRQTVVMHHFYGHTVSDVADMLDIPLGTAKSRLRDGILSLRHGVLAALHHPGHTAPLPHGGKGATDDIAAIRASG